MVYESYDGEIFKSKDECEQHEYKMNHLPVNIVWYDKDGNELVPETSEEVEKMYNEVDIMEILNGEHWREDLDFLYQNWGFGERNMEPGFYKYTGDWDYDELEPYHGTDRIYGWDEWLRMARRPH
jgi:hypothetical protein